MTARPVALTVTLVVDLDAWAREYGIPVEQVRDDVRAHLANVVEGTYGPDGLGLAERTAVKRPSSHRNARMRW